MAGVAGVLAALALTASGCGATPLPAPPIEDSAQATEAPTAAAPVVESKNQITSFDASKVVVDAAWGNTFGENPSMIDEVTKSGVNIMSIIYGENPEYTLHGFMPNESHFQAATSKLRPFVDDSAIQQMKNDWLTKKEIPILSSYRSDAVGANADRQYTFRTADGQVCTDSAEVPYEIEMDAVRLEARDHISGTKKPVFNGDIVITVQCQEGGTLLGNMTTTFFMKSSGDSWIMSDGYVVQHKEGTNFQRIN